MNVQFKETKTNKIYEDFVNEPTDRKKQRAFSKQFGNQIASEAVKLHQRLLAYPTAGAYNKDYGLTKNRVETKSGVKNNDPMIFKVRVTGSWRKFFNNVIDESTPKSPAHIFVVSLRLFAQNSVPLHRNLETSHVLQETTALSA